MRISRRRQLLAGSILAYGRAAQRLDLVALEPAAALEAGDPQMQAGETVTVDDCPGRRTSNGAGITLMLPPLGGSQIVRQTDPTSLLAW